MKKPYLVRFLFVLFVFKNLCLAQGYIADASSPAFVGGEPFVNTQIINGFLGFNKKISITWNLPSQAIEHVDLLWKSQESEVSRIFKCDITNTTTNNFRCFHNTKAPSHLIHSIRMSLYVSSIDSQQQQAIVEIKLRDMQLAFNNSLLIFKYENFASKKFEYEAPIYVFEPCKLAVCDKKVVVETASMTCLGCTATFSCAPAYTMNYNTVQCIGNVTYSKWSKSSVCPVCTTAPRLRPIHIQPRSTSKQLHDVGVMSEAGSIAVVIFGFGILCMIVYSGHKMMGKSAADRVEYHSESEPEDVYGS